MKFNTETTTKFNFSFIYSSTRKNIKQTLIKSTEPKKVAQIKTKSSKTQKDVSPFYKKGQTNTHKYRSINVKDGFRLKPITHTERERERERETDRQTDRLTDRESESQRERD